MINKYSSSELVCLFNQSVRADTCMGPEGNKLKQKPEPGLKSLYSMPTVKPLPTTRVNNFAFSMRKKILISSHYAQCWQWWLLVAVAGVF